MTQTSTDFQPFPSAEDRAAMRAAFHAKQGGAPVNTNNLAKAHVSRVHPQTGGAQVTMVPQSVEPIGAPSPRVQAMQRAQGMAPGPQIDPALMAAVEGRAVQAPAPVRPPMPRAPEVYAQPEAEWHETPRPHAQTFPVGSVENVMPGYQAPISDAEGESLALPSRFAYYQFKDLYVRPFKGGHLAKLARAASSGSLQPFVEAVDTVVYCSDPTIKNVAFKLTMPDFWFVLHWLRHNSYTKGTYTHSDTCRNEGHRERVAAKELDKATLRMQMTISKTTLTTHELEFIPNPEEFSLPELSGYYVAPPTMRDALEFLEHPLMRNQETRVEFAYLAQKASHLHGLYEYVPLDKRVEYVENAEASTSLMLDEFATAVKGYGVEESVTMNCKVCGASRKSNIVLDASTFLAND